MEIVNSYDLPRMPEHELVDLLYFKNWTYKSNTYMLNYWSPSTKKSSLVHLTNQSVIAKDLNYKIVRQIVLTDMICFVLSDFSLVYKRLVCILYSKMDREGIFEELYTAAVDKATIVYENATCTTEAISMYDTDISYSAVFQCDNGRRLIAKL